MNNLFSYDLTNQTITDNTGREIDGITGTKIYKLGEIFINFINYDFSEYESLRRKASLIFPNSRFSDISEFSKQFPLTSFFPDLEIPNNWQTKWEKVKLNPAQYKSLYERNPNIILRYLTTAILHRIENVPYCDIFSPLVSFQEQFDNEEYLDFLFLQKKIIADWVPCIISDNSKKSSALQKYMKKNNLTFKMEGLSFQEVTIFRYMYSLHEHAIHSIQQDPNLKKFINKSEIIEESPKEAVSLSGKEKAEIPKWEGKEIEIIHGYTFNTPEEALQCEFLKMLELGIKIRKCAVCGKYFIITGHNGKCCDNLYKDTGLTCQQVFSDRNYKNKRKQNPILKEYDKAYKRMYARYSNKKNLTSKEYDKWKEQAKQERDRVLEAYNKSPSDSIVNSFKQFLGNK